MRTFTVTAMAAFVSALAAAPHAWGAGQPLAGGQARLELDRGIASALHNEGVEIKALGPARLKGRKLTLPVASGVFNQEADGATFVQAGGLKLVSAGKTVAVRRLTVDSSAKSLSATVAGKRMRLTRLAGAKLERAGFDYRLEARRLPLTGAAAAVLNRMLGLPGVLRAGRSLGSVDGLGEPSAVQIGFGHIAIGGPETTFSKLESLGVQIGPWGATEKWSTGAETYFLFPIEPTTVAPDASAGIIEAEPNDGVSMEIESPPPRNVLLRGVHLDLAARALSATVSSLSSENAVTATIATLDYTVAKFQVRPKVGGFELMGIKAIASQFVADRLNEQFATPGLFQAGETLARITVTLHAR